MTVACARCHDHKYDPIPAADYYALYGVFASARKSRTMTAAAKWPTQPSRSIHTFSCVAAPAIAARTPSVDSSPSSSPDHKPKPFEHGSGRLELAKDIASRDNPLTARVWVNRVWDHLFGKGWSIRRATSAVRGTPPTHPELLDTLACDFMDDSWSTKHLIRRIVLSATYRQASEIAPRMRRGRSRESTLSGAPTAADSISKSLRDSLLAVAGRLDEKMGGPSVSIVDAPFSTRRSVYGFIERQNLPAFFRTFDFANPNTHTPDRSQTTVPQQALFLMNSPFTIEQASYLAAAAKRGAEVEPKATPPKLGNAAVTRPPHRATVPLALGREPSIDEVTDALEFVDRGDAAAITTIQNQSPGNSAGAPSTKRPTPFTSNRCRTS